MKTLSLGYSPCPNDTFIFYALVHGKIDTGDLQFKEILLDVETLNRSAIKGELDITKVSYNAFGNLRDDYCLLRSGGALGRGCGPLVVSKRNYSMKDLKGKRIAIPGELTTAYLLLQLYDPDLKKNIKVMPFNMVMDAVKKGEVDAGLIIHESRFTYKAYGLKKVIDLGEWWEKETGLPIPLGCISAKRSIGSELINKIDSLIKESIFYSMAHKKESTEYIKNHSQELEGLVIEQHINLYVNDYSIDIGEDGIKAVQALFEMAGEKGIIKKSLLSLFA
ncbi:MAG: 1,4-dihydroxy-6-naphthoate synthase [Nitrospirota bacterium]